MITAHGGALKTGRNSRRYFEAVERGEIVSDALEVDVRERGGRLFISHLCPLSARNKISVDYVLEFAKAHGKTVNFDIKQSKLFLPVLELAKRHAAEDFLLFTGATQPEHIAYLSVGVVYANDCFFTKTGLKYIENDVKGLKAYIDSFNNPRLKGINVNYKRVTDAFLKSCKKEGLGVSLYTVDNEKALKKYIPCGFDNITTNRPDLALKIKNQYTIGGKI